MDKNLEFWRAKARYLQATLDTREAADYLKSHGVCLELALAILTRP